MIYIQVKNMGISSSFKLSNIFNVSIVILILYVFGKLFEYLAEVFFYDNLTDRMEEI